MTQQQVLIPTNSANLTRWSIPVGTLETATIAGPRSAPEAPMVVFMNKEEAIYWSYQWQVGEKETRDNLDKGLGKKFKDGEEAIRWLLTVDED